MTILSYITIFGPIFSAILENLWEPFFLNVPKTAILAVIGHFYLIWPNLAPKTNFLGQNDYSILKTIFGPTFSAILQNLLELYFRNVPKNCDFGQKWPFFGTLGQIWAK